MKDEETATVPNDRGYQATMLGNGGNRSRIGRRAWVIIAVLVVAIAAAAYWLIKQPKSAGAGPTDEAGSAVVSVQVAKAERQPIAAEVAALGTVFPHREATVSAKVAAQIKQMALLKNKPVKEGDAVVVLESRDLQAQRAEAEAALHEAELNERNVIAGAIPQTTAQDEKALRDARANLANASAIYERRKGLFENGGISVKDLEASALAFHQAESDLRLAESTAKLHATATGPNDRAVAASRVNQARQHLATLDTQLSYATIRAPFSGVLTEQFQFQGEFASPGGKLFTVGDMTEVIVKVPFADTVAAQLKTGDSATVIAQEFPDEKLTGTIALVSRATDPVSRTVEVWVRLKNEGGKLRSDSAARVVVATKSEDDAIVAPAQAVTLDATNADAGTVMVVDDQNVAHETKVTVGIRTADRVQITSGLKGGETVVTVGNYALPDGAKVSVEEPETDDKGGAEKDDEKKGDEK